MQLDCEDGEGSARGTTSLFFRKITVKDVDVKSSLLDIALVKKHVRCNIPLTLCFDNDRSKAYQTL